MRYLLTMVAGVALLGFSAPAAQAETDWEELRSMSREERKETMQGLSEAERDAFFKEREAYKESVSQEEREAMREQKQTRQRNDGSGRPESVGDNYQNGTGNRRGGGRSQ